MEGLLRRWSEIKRKPSPNDHMYYLYINGRVFVKRGRTFPVKIFPGRGPPSTFDGGGGWYRGAILHISAWGIEKDRLKVDL